MIKKKERKILNQYSIDNKNAKTLCHKLSIRRITIFTEEQKDYLHAVETSSSRSITCIFGIVLLLEREPRRQINADLKMANETRVLIHAIVEA